MSERYDIMMPAVALGIIEVQVDEDTNSSMDVMVMEFSTGSTRYQVRIADKSNYRQVADKLAENIRRAGAEMRGPHTKLITNVKDLPDGIRKIS